VTSPSSRPTTTDPVHALLHTLTAPWSQPIMQRALLESALLGTAGGLLGCWLVLHRLAYPAESLAHGLLPGLVGATLLGVPLLLGAAAGLLVAALAVAFAARVPLVDRDSAVAAVVATLLGAGIVLALSPASPPGIGGLLFGDVLGATDTDLVAAGALVALLAAALPLAHARLLAVGFDRGAAATLGARPGPTDAALLVLLAATLLVAVQGLGNLLVVALLLAPAGAARRLTRRAGPMLAASVAIALAGAVGGLYLSYYARTAASASIAAVLVAAFVLARVATYDRSTP
jgi:ABC-type Mn2+/Zn2+ transport system permease subunit